LGKDLAIVSSDGVEGPAWEWPEVCMNHIRRHPNIVLQPLDNDVHIEGTTVMGNTGKFVRSICQVGWRNIEVVSRAYSVLCHISEVGRRDCSASLGRFGKGDSVKYLPKLDVGNIEV
jgi:hypothetical protein